MAQLPDDIARINALTTNARNTWFVLLGVLVFVGITLMGVEHIDFYGVDRATKLPLVDVEVPTRFFFISAPILIAAVYGYFHLYLIRLWDALSDADARHDDRPLGDLITPWLVTDAALHLRRWLRHDEAPCTTPPHHGKCGDGAEFLAGLGIRLGGHCAALVAVHAGPLVPDDSGLGRGPAIMSINWGSQLWNVL